MKIKTIICALALYLCTAVAVNAAEFIKSFDSQIEIGADAKLTVTETIVVNAEGRDIKRGIFRDFPTQYTDSEGVFHKNGFSIRSVTRNGKPEQYHQKKTSFGVRIYFGSSDRFLKSGEHKYVLTYVTTNQLRFFKEHDELYWNVTGNEWVFPIEKVSATVLWPENVDPMQVDTTAFTGRKGTTGKQYKVMPATEHVMFETTAALGAKEGFTIAAKWPKGLIAEPAGARPDNRYLLGAFGGLASLFAFYLFSWFRKGKDPTKTNHRAQLMPDYEHSPAAYRYVNNMGYDPKTFTVSIVSMAVKGLLRIRDDDGVYTLEKTGKDVELYNDEYEAKGKLFLSKNSLKIQNSSHWSIRRALTRHQKSLRKDYKGKYFKLNTSTVWWAQIITWITVLLLFFYTSQHGRTQEFIFSFFVMVAWTTMAIILIPALIRLWRGERTYNLFLRLLIGVLLPVIYMMMISGTGPSNFFSMYSLRLLVLNGVLPVMLVLLAINVAFYYWMKAPTKVGQDMLDKIESFKLYLKLANEDYIEFDEELRLTPERYDRYLPYAMALDFESEWGEFVHGMFSNIGDTTTGVRQPDWYEGDGFQDNDFTGFSRSVGTSLSSSLVSASVDPTATSSSGGGSSGGGSSGFSGGSSGGGGGGGGGGGW